MNAITGSRVNGTVVLVAGILGVAIVFSLAASVVAIRGADPELPNDYHWEGAQFERDVALARRADDLRVRALLRVDAAGGVCRLSLKSAGPQPARLTLVFIHGTDERLDRRVRLMRNRDGYEGACGPLLGSHYHVELADEPMTWRIRTEMGTPRESFEFGTPAAGG